ncbi:MAG: hypothetical protein LQ346_007114 [Caloplaca aetnensis]|nr:MAG: hypothetical protein LQ346_007114 [Caloplaca aetnensis]
MTAVSVYFLGEMVTAKSSLISAALIGQSQKFDVPASHQLNPDDAPAAAARTLNSLHDDQYIRRFAHPIRELAEGDLQSASTKLDQGSFDLISGSPEAKLDTCVEAAPVSSKPLNNESFVLPATPSPEFNAGNDLSESLQQSASIQLDTDACSKRPSFSANSIPPQPVSHPTTFSQPDADAVLLVSSSSTASSSSAVSGNATAPATTSRVDVHTVYATYFQRLKQLKQIVYGQAWDQLIVLVTSIADVKIFHEGIRRQWGESVTGIHQFHRQETQNQRMRQFNRGFQRILITTSQFFLSHSSMLRSPPHLVFLRPPHTLQDFHATITRVGRAGKPSIITFYYDPFNWREDQLMR